MGASKKQCEELLEFIRHLAEDDKEGVMAVKVALTVHVYVHMWIFACCAQVLDLLWNLAHREDCPPDTMDHALSAHIKILDYSCSQVCHYMPLILVVDVLWCRRERVRSCIGCNAVWMI